MYRLIKQTIERETIKIKSALKILIINDNQNMTHTTLQNMV